MEGGGTGLARTFEELWIWQRARVVVRRTYSDFGRATPSERDFAFRDQIRRAAISVMNNIAEGFERSNRAEFVRFLDFAKASCGEIRSMYYLAEDLSYAEQETTVHRREDVAKLSAGIVALQQYLKKV